MALKTATVTITAEGRDKGKVFLLTEMPAFPADAWATRLLLALTKAGADIPPDVRRYGLAGILSLGLSAFGRIAYDDAKSLLDELWDCVQVQPDPTRPAIIRKINTGPQGDIEELLTIQRLRVEVLQLHVNFSVAAGLRGLMERVSEAAKVALSSTQTPRPRSRRSSRQG